MSRETQKHKVATSSSEAAPRYTSLLGAGAIEVAWTTEEEPVTLRDPRKAERLAADVPVVLGIPSRNAA
ncbi:MAG: hypothetical protein U0235_23655 [Polyangiaceae bacterium]